MEDVRYQKLIEHSIREHLREGRTVKFTVSGDSMRPLIRKGDRVHVEQCNPRDLSAGDIITYRNDALYVTHRVLWITRRGDGIRLITKGDSEITLDPPFSSNHMIGKVIAIGRADRTLRLEAPYWSLINHLLWMLSLAETISFLLYRLAVAKFHPFTPSLLAKLKPTRLYGHLKKRGVGFETRITS